MVRVGWHLGGQEGWLAGGALSLFLVPEAPVSSVPLGAHLPRPHLPSNKSQGGLRR